MEELKAVSVENLEVLERSCPRCGKSSANSSNPAGRCRKHLNKLSADKKKPGHWQRAQTKADDALRRQKGKNGTAHKKSSGLGSRASIVAQTESAERKTGQKLSPDRKDNGKGYASSNTRMVPEKLNRGRHHVDGKKLRAWQKRIKKTGTSDEEFYTYVLAKAQETNNLELLTLLDDMHPNDLANFINNEDVEKIEPSLEEFTKSYIEKYQPLEKSTEVSLFKRYEDKYILPIAIKDQLESLLKKHLEPDYPTKDTKFNQMRSVYFDSVNLDMIKQHLSKSESRFKIRTREYAPNGKLNKSDFTYLEVKAKHRDVSDKFRIKVPNSSMESFMAGKPVITDIRLAKANPHIGIADLVKRVSDINSAMFMFSLKPSCEISYTRRAFCAGDLRVTFDEDVSSKILSGCLGSELVKTDPAIETMASGYNPNQHLILEVKHQGSVPDWLTQFLNANNIVKTSFSKYCYSIGQHTKKNNMIV